MLFYVAIVSCILLLSSKEYRVLTSYFKIHKVEAH